MGGRRGRERKKGKMRVKGGICYVLKKRNNKRVFHDLMGKTLLRLKFFQNRKKKEKGRGYRGVASSFYI